MEETTYRVMDAFGNPEGRYLSLTNALLLIEALYNKYYLEPSLKFSIQREAKNTILSENNTEE